MILVLTARTDAHKINIHVKDVQYISNSYMNLKSCSAIMNLQTWAFRFSQNVSKTYNYWSIFQIITAYKHHAKI